MTQPDDRPELSVVIPAFNAGETIAATIDSVFAAADRPSLEVIVVDDGSDDGDRLRREFVRHPSVRLIAHERNRGMCAARNTGIAASRGAIVTILDADDCLVADWPVAYRCLMARWPRELKLCFAGCRNAAGQPTMREAGYDGEMNLATFLSERFSGEYLPMFRGDYVRGKPYVDIGTRKSCGNLSYIAWLQEGPIYISAEVLRIYDDSRSGAISRDWLSPAKAGESVRCLEEELARYGELLSVEAPDKLADRWLKLAIYRRAARRPGVWTALFRGVRTGAHLAALAASVMVLIGPTATSALIGLAKQLNLVRRYG